jgi:hypothetical protein
MHYMQICLAITSTYVPQVNNYSFHRIYSVGLPVGFLMAAQFAILVQRFSNVSLDNLKWLRNSSGIFLGMTPWWYLLTLVISCLWCRRIGKIIDAIMQCSTTKAWLPPANLLPCTVLPISVQSFVANKCCKWLPLVTYSYQT